MNEPLRVAKDLGDALSSLQERTRTLRDIVERLAEAEPVQEQEAEQALHRAWQAAEALRARLGVGLTLLGAARRPPLGQDEAPIERRVEEMVRRLEALASALPRVRVERLADELLRGSIAPHLPNINRRARERDRDHAARELNDALARAEGPIEAFPGPDDPGLTWLGWFWSLAVEAEQVLGELAQAWPRLTSFLEAVTAQEWIPGAAPGSEPADGPLQAEPVPQPAEPAPPPTTVSLEGDVLTSAPVLPAEVISPPQALDSTAGEGLPASSQHSSRKPVLGKQPQPSPPRPERTPVRPSPPLKATGPTGFLPPSLTTRIATEMREPPRREEGGSPKPESTPPDAGVVAAALAEQEPAPLDLSPRAPAATPLEPSASQPAVVAPPSAESEGTDDEDMAALSANHRWPESSTWLDQHWVDPERRVAPGPWLNPDFGVEVGRAQFEALRAGRWGEAAVLGAMESRTKERFDSARLSEQEVTDLLHFARGSLPRDPTREDLLVTWIHQEVSEARSRSSVANRLRFGLAAFNPSVSALFAPDRWSDACELLEFSSSFKELLGEWHSFTRAATEPYLLLRRQMNNGESATTTEALQTLLANAQEELRSAIRRYSHAGGGSVQRTHCREAWDAYMQEALPVLKGIAERRAIEEDAKALARLPDKAKRIFDRLGAKYIDRKQMDKLVDELDDAAYAVVELHQRLQMRRDGVEQEPRLLPDSALQLWLQANSPDLLPEEGLLLEITRPLVRGRKETISTALAYEELRRRPWLIAAWAPSTCHEGRGLASEACERSQVAAASLLWPPLPTPVEDLRAWLTNNRPLLLSQLADSKEPSRHRILREQEDLRDRVSSKVAEVRILQHRLDALADPSARKLDDALRGAEIALREYAGEDLVLVLDWLDHIGVEAEERERRVVAAQQRQAILEKVPENDVRELIEARRYADLLSRIGSPHVSSHPTHRRATPFRGEAAKRYASPRYALQKAEGLEPRVKSLVDAWFRAGANASQPIPPHQEEELRNLFCEVVFEPETKKRKTRVRARTREHRIDAQGLREWLDHEVEKPNFLPQVTRFSEVRILTVPGAVGDRSLPARIAGQGETGVLSILLAPNLSPDRRSECREKLRGADPARPVALLDDLDLCRLLNPRGQQPVLIEGLMEIALEQQRWSAFTPYEVQEGQHVKMEMYVGRSDEANRLATSTAYSRIFSGRRLGKTALLRFVEHTKRKYTLPSGNVLHVLYVPIVGFQNESALVDEILNAVYRHFGVEAALPDRGEPGDRLERGLDLVLSQHHAISLLVFLDEADTFFEGQLDGPAGEPAQHERALSWRMRKLEARRDSMGLPRIRFLFCGYRQTNRSEGAWANWGDVLQLKPLEPEDAVRLVVGPLARIGIDAREQADAIAFRCGYQPALVIRFCVQLVEHLERTRPVQLRDEVKVSPRDVATVFNTHEVQNAIREVTWLNFVGNPGGQLIFASLLKELGERPPGSSIEDAPGQLLEQIAQLTDPTQLSTIGGTNWTDFAVRHLRELLARSLLSESSRNPLSVRLRFPHHLPILLQDDPSSRIKSALELLSSASPARGGGRWLLPDDILARIRWSRGPDARELGVRGVVVGGSWVEPLLDSAQGLSFHLGQDGSAATTEVVLADGRTFRQARRTLDWEGVRIFVGRADLLREALRQEQEGDAIFEVVPIGRLTMSGVQAWFQKSRGVEFSDPDALQRIMAHTGGIPRLVKLLDDNIMSRFDHGATLERSDLEAMLRSVQETVPQVVKDLVKGPAETRLDAREIELLRLLWAVARQHTSWDDFKTCATDRDLWDGELDKLGVEPVDLEDRSHLSLLLALGWLPRRYEGTTPGLESVGVPGPQDPLSRIVDLLAR